MNAEHNDPRESGTEGVQPRSGVKRKRVLWSSVAAALVVGGCVAVGYLILNPLDAASTTQTVPASSTKLATADVERVTLQGIVTRQGKLSRADGPAPGDGIAGRLTEVPAVGTRLHARDVLYRVDNTPVVFFEGALPQWRSFEPGMPDGPDVGQVQANLHSWGYLSAAADNNYGGRTVAAVKAWQKDVGLPVTGSIEMGRIQFLTGEFEVSELKAKTGNRVGDGAVYLTKRTERTVTVSLSAGSPLAVVDRAATIDLPSGVSVGGTIRSIDAAKASDDGKTSQLVTIAIADQDALGTLTDANVTINFIGGVKEGVLSVPTIALGAASDGGFLVEIVGKSGKTTTVPVKTGMFAGDRVEVTGKISEGQKVVVPG